MNDFKKSLRIDNITAKKALNKNDKEIKGLNLKESAKKAAKTADKEKDGEER